MRAVALADAAAEELLGPSRSEVADRLEAEHDTLRAALDWFVARDDLARAARMVEVLREFGVRADTR